MSGMISSLMVPCHLMAIAQEGATTAGNPDPIALATTAHAAWGSRALAKIDHLVPIGRPYGTGRVSPPLVQLLSAQFTFLARPQRYALAPSPVVHWAAPGDTLRDAVNIVVPESGNDQIVAMLTRAETLLEAEGAELE